MARARTRNDSDWMILVWAGIVVVALLAFVAVVTILRSAGWVH